MIREVTAATGAVGNHGGMLVLSFVRITTTTVAAASIDPEVRAIQKERHAYYTRFYVEIIERAKARGEVPPDTDSDHAATLFTGPVFARHLEALEPIDARWITGHVDKTAALLLRD